MAEDKTVIGTLGRLSSVKGHRVLIDAFAKGLKLYKNMQLFIVGEGGELDNIREQIGELGIEGNVVLDGGDKTSVENYFKCICFS